MGKINKVLSSDPDHDLAYSQFLADKIKNVFGWSVKPDRTNANAGYVPMVQRWLDEWDRLKGDAPNSGTIVPNEGTK